VKSFSIPDNVDDVTKYALQVGLGFQIRLVWTGSLKIERVVLWAAAIDDTDYVEREGQEPTCVPNDVSGNEVRYEIPLGNIPHPNRLGFIVGGTPDYGPTVNITAPISILDTPNIVTEFDEEILITAVNVTGGVFSPYQTFFPLPVQGALDPFTYVVTGSGSLEFIHTGANSPLVLNVTANAPSASSMGTAVGGLDFSNPKTIPLAIGNTRDTKLRASGVPLHIVMVDVTGGVTLSSSSPLEFTVPGAGNLGPYLNVASSGTATFHHDGTGSPYVLNVTAF
jgi:hypothetical protein